MTDREKMIEVMVEWGMKPGDNHGELADRLIAAGFGMVNSEKLNAAWKIANNAIYFDDSSDYRSALWEVANLSRPEGVDSDSIGEKYVEEFK